VRRDALFASIREANRELAESLLADKGDSERVRDVVPLKFLLSISGRLLQLNSRSGGSSEAVGEAFGEMAARPPFRGVGVNVFDAGLVTASHEEISRKQGVSLLAIGRWRKRWAAKGLEGERRQVHEQADEPERPDGEERQASFSR
jgi:hypothetical protein